MFSKPYGTLRVTEETPDGQVLDMTEQEIDSYVENFLNLGSAVWGNQQVSGVTDTGGSTRTLASGGNANRVWNANGAQGSTDHGIQIGDDGTTETVTDTALGNQLTTGISYGATTISPASVAAPNATLDITRTFTNNTGGSVTIREVGVAFRHDDSNVNRRRFLGLRDTGSPLQTVSDGNNTTVEYQLSITV